MFGQVAGYRHYASHTDALDIHNLQWNNIIHRDGFYPALIIRLHFRAFPCIRFSAHAHLFELRQNAAGEAVLAAIDTSLAIGAPQKILQ